MSNENVTVIDIVAQVTDNTSAGAASATQTRVETQLGTVLRNMGVGNEGFNAITQHARDLQKQTMFSNRAMIAGAGELSTYLTDPNLSMEIYLTDLETGDRLRFPMLPAKINANTGAIFQSYTILAVGAIEIPAGEELTGFSWTGMLPGKARENDPYVKEWRSPQEINVLWSIYRQQKKKLRLLITETPVNHDVYIQRYTMEYSGGYGDYMYVFENTSHKHKDLILGDESIKVFFNTKGAMDDVEPDVEAFLKYVDGISSDNEFVREIDKEVKHVKNDEEWRKAYMMSVIYDAEIREEAKQEERQHGINAMIDLLSEMGQTPEFIRRKISEKYSLSQQEAETYFNEWIWK